MLDTEPNDTTSTTDQTTPDAAAQRPRRRRAASRPAGPPAATGEAGPAASSSDAAGPAAGAGEPATDGPPAKKAAAKKTAAKKTAAKKTAAKKTAQEPRRRASKSAAADAAVESATDEAPTRTSDEATTEPAPDEGSAPSSRRRRKAAPPPPILFQAAESAAVSARPPATDGAEPTDAGDAAEEVVDDEAADDGSTAEGGHRKRRRRGGRGRRRRTEGGVDEAADDGSGGTAADTDATTSEGDADGDDGEGADGEGPTRRRRRRRRRGSDGEGEPDAEGVVTHVREPRRRASRDTDEVTGVRGSTRLEAKKQRRREGRESGRRRPPILTEAEFLARREAVRREMVVRQTGDVTQIAVLEDGVLVEHYVATASSSTMVGNVFLGKVQNVLPSMEAAFVDIGRGRNAVLYAGEVNWDAAGLDGQPKRIEHVLKSGDAVLVQVTKDPVGHKGSRLTSNISLPGRFLVYVPDGAMSGISRKLPDTERTRLKTVLKGIVPDDAGVIVRTAAEGATEEQLTEDVGRLRAQWDDIEQKAKTATAPALLYGEPDLTVRVIRDLFNEDFERLVVEGDEAWETVQAYVTRVAPDLVDRLQKHVGTSDVFAEHRIDEQIAKGLDRKVWLPSGGSLVIDRTEAMTVIDVNTGKFVGKGSGNLEETVTRNNLEAAEEIVRQLRLRDVGGIIVIDFIDMVLESNRELVLRRLTECLGRDRTKHQVAEVTSLGLVQMTRKRIGQGLLEAFSEPCEVCHGRGVIVRTEPVELRASRARTERNAGLDRVARASKGRKGGDDATAEAAREGGEGAEAVEAAEAAVRPARSRRRRATKAQGPAEPVSPDTVAVAVEEAVAEPVG